MMKMINIQSEALNGRVKDIGMPNFVNVVVGWLELKLRLADDSVYVNQFG